MTQENKHTPGIWTYSRECAYGYDIRSNDVRDGIWVANVHNEHGNENGFPSAQEKEANARLIAAAPELLECLEGVFEALKEGTYGESHVEWIIRAIAKARGK